MKARKVKERRSELRSDLCVYDRLQLGDFVGIWHEVVRALENHHSKSYYSKSNRRGYDLKNKTKGHFLAPSYK